MGWRGLTRSLLAAARQAERQQQRRHRELLKQQQRSRRAELQQQRGLEKHLEIAYAAQVVAEHEAYVRRIVTVHLNGSHPRDWHAIAHAPPPPAPPYLAYHEQHAQRTSLAYSPSIGDRLLGKADDKRQHLEEAIAAARHADQVAYQLATQDHQSRHQRWQWESDLAHAILAGDVEAHQAALDFLFPVAEIPELASLVLASATPWCVDATMALHADDDLIPDEYPTQLKSGKLSWKKLPKGQYNQLFQDHVCSCALRIAWELFALVPISMALVHVLLDMVNTATGHQEPTPVLSVAVTRDALLKLNPERLDPSDSMSNFVHEMDFSPRSGFKASSRLAVGDFSLPPHLVRS